MSRTPAHPHTRTLLMHTAPPRPARTHAHVLTVLTALTVLISVLTVLTAPTVLICVLTMPPCTDMPSDCTDCTDHYRVCTDTVLISTESVLILY